MNNEIILYTSPEGHKKVAVYYQGETVWLTQKQLAELFDVEVQTINYHLKEIFKSGELDEGSVIRKFRITAEDGKEYLTGCYNLDAIIAVGYRVNSLQATRFRVWATQTLREFIIKGFVLDDERLKQGQQFGKDYFEELLERIREIRAKVPLVCGAVNAAFIKKSPIFTSSAVSITKKTPKSRSRFSKLYKINCTGLSQAKPPPKSLLFAPMQKIPIWVSLPGKKPLKAQF